MKRFLLLFTMLSLLSAGCITTSLQRHAVDQIASVTDYRYEATLHALAMVAADQGILPSYALISNGATGITDTGIINPVSNWGGSAPYIFKSEAIGVTGSRQPQVLWTIDPVADHTQLQAIRSACQWVLYKDKRTDPECVNILANPDDPEVAKNSGPGPHFGVLWRLNRLPECWLRMGRLCDVPLNARYKEHCGDVWVWVMPEGMQGLSEFTLVLQDIATLNVAPTDGSSLPANISPPLLVTLWVYQTVLSDPKGSCAGTPDITIDIVNNNGTIEYQQNNIKVDNVIVTVGQTVAWRNKDPNTSHSATNQNIFDTDMIPSGGEARVLITDKIYSSLYRGSPTEQVIVPYYSKESAESIKQIKSTIALTIKPIVVTIESANNNWNNWLIRTDNVVYKLANVIEPLGNIKATVGQAVVWVNKTDKARRVTIKKRHSVDTLFSTDEIGPGKVKGILFDSSMFTKAGGSSGSEVVLSFDNNDNARIILKDKDDDSKTAYSKTLVFQVDRVVKPEHKEDVEKAICKGVSSGKSPHDAVDIQWETWLQWTDPFQGQRTSVKPGTATANPVSNTRPVTRPQTLTGDKLLIAPKIYTLESEKK
jgi:plastocyanin